MIVFMVETPDKGVILIETNDTRGPVDQEMLRSMGLNPKRYQGDFDAISRTGLPFYGSIDVWLGDEYGIAIIEVDGDDDHQ
jgi:hypothetical protein